MKTEFRSPFLPAALLLVASIVGFKSISSEPEESEPVAPRPVPFLGTIPALSSGFYDWGFCSTEGKTESLPMGLHATHWGPAALDGSTGCSSCGDGNGTQWDLMTAALGLSLNPPYDPLGDVGELPPPPVDHASVMASSGEVVLTETDFTLEGRGFDFAFTRTYRSGLAHEGWAGYGWAHSAENILIEQNQDVMAYLGNARVEDVYEWTSSGYTSPSGFNDLLTKGTRPTNYSNATYAGLDFFTKTEKNGIQWEFDLAYTTPTPAYVCTRIVDPWGNEITFEYASASPMKLTEAIDTLGRKIQFSYVNNLLTQVVVLGSAVSDYGNITIDYGYNSSTGDLTRVDKHKTRLSLGGSIVRPYTEYSYLSGTTTAHNIEKVRYSKTQDFFTFGYSTGLVDRCTSVTDADGETHTYAFDQGSGSDRWTEYTDPGGQRRDFVYEDFAAGDRTIAEVREHWEDLAGSASTLSLKIERNCACGKITEIEYPDTSKENWDYDADGNLLKYTRTSSDVSDPALVKQWTYASFSSFSRMLTSSGRLQATLNPGARIYYVWDATGKLDTVTWPTATLPDSSTQAIVWDYGFGALGALSSMSDPDGNLTTYTQSGLTTTTTRGSGSETMESKYTVNVLGEVVSREGKYGNVSEWTYAVTPDGRVLQALGPNSQDDKTTYRLDGWRMSTSKKVDASNTEDVTYVRTVAGRTLETHRDPAGLNLVWANGGDVSSSERTSNSLDPDGYGTENKAGYGSYGLPWKSYNLEEVGSTTTKIQTALFERDNMGRIEAVVSMAGTRTEYQYDGYGRQEKMIRDLPGGATLEEQRVLTSWGAVSSTTAWSSSSGSLASEVNFFDEAGRLWKREEVDTTSVLTNLVTLLERDAKGRVVKETDASGSEWITEFRADGRLKRFASPGGDETVYTYDDTLRTETETERLKSTTTGNYTDFVVTTTHNKSGHATSMADFGSGTGSRTTALANDLLGRLRLITSPGGSELEMTYDRIGRMTHEETLIGGAVTAVREKVYTDGGRVDKEVDPNARVTDFEWDSFGRMESVSLDQGGGTWAVYARTYDTYGRLGTITDPMGVVITLNYDAGNRLDYADINKGSSGLGGPDRLDYGYDDLGRVTLGKTQENVGGVYTDLTTVSRSYDGFGRLDSETQNGKQLGLTRNSMGYVTGLDYPSAGPIDELEYTLDNLGRVSVLKRKLDSMVEGAPGGTLETSASFEYLGFNEESRTQTLFDLERTQVWNDFLEPEELRFENTITNTLLTGVKHTWDTDGDPVVRTRLHDNDGTYDWGEVYRYDDAGRLIKAWSNVRNPENYAVTEPTSSAQYDVEKEYDLGKANERKKLETTPKNGLTATKTYTNNAGYQYTKVGGNTSVLTWDANGQLLSWAGNTYSWSALGQMTSVTQSSGGTVSYKYDAFGRRSLTTTGGETKQALYHGRQMIGEWNQTTSAWTWQQIAQNDTHGVIEHISLDTNDLDGDSNTTEYRSYAMHQDWQESALSVSDTAGVVQERYLRADAFGTIYAEDGSGGYLGHVSQIFQPVRMHGGLVEAVTGLQEFGFRWYAPWMGGWLSRDPLGTVDSSNLYQFVGGSPMRSRDPLGLMVGGGISVNVFVTPPPAGGGLGEPIWKPVNPPGIPGIIIDCEEAEKMVKAEGTAAQDKAGDDQLLDDPALTGAAVVDFVAKAIQSALSNVGVNIDVPANSDGAAHTYHVKRWNAEIDAVKAAICSGGARGGEEPTSEAAKFINLNCPKIAQALLDYCAKISGEYL